jgi:hypothetical protein
MGWHIYGGPGVPHTFFVPFRGGGDVTLLNASTNEIKGVSLPNVNIGREDTNNHVIKIGKLMGVNIEHKDISVSHRTS